jgi:hypothetical protein
MKKKNYIERWVKWLSNPFTAIFELFVPVVAFKVQIYSCQMTAVPIKWTVHSPTEPAKLTEIAQSCGLAILVAFIPYLCLLDIKYDV